MEGQWRLRQLGRRREGLRRAFALLAQAGYELKGTDLVNRASGRPFTFEILATTRDQERLALVFVRSLKRAGINAQVRSIDATQFERRRIAFDFDMMDYRWEQSLSPGNEQYFYWGSAAADQQGSRNYMGVKSPAVDAMIAAMLHATERDDFVAATRALDRVLLLSGFCGAPILPAQAMGGALEADRASLKHLVVRLFAGDLVARGRPMILGNAQLEVSSEKASGGTTLDDLFRRAALRNIDAVALADPPNRESFADGAPRKLTYAQADRAISAMAAQLRRLGLQTDAVVAMQLPNTVEGVIAVLGVLRAGMIAAPLPLLWRKHDIVTALRPLGAKAIITASRVGSVAHAEIAMQVAAELFPVRYVCGFGSELPDGVVPLDALLAPDPLDFEPSPARSGDAAAHVAVITFAEGADGICPLARNQKELIAGGFGPYLESGGAQDGHLLSTIPLSSFAGLSLTLLPWLLGGGTLNLHHAFDPDSFATQTGEQDGGVIVVPGRCWLLAEADFGRPERSALWRSPERLAGGVLARRRHVGRRRQLGESVLDCGAGPTACLRRFLWRRRCAARFGSRHHGGGDHAQRRQHAAARPHGAGAGSPPGAEQGSEPHFGPDPASSYRLLRPIVTARH